MNSPARHHVTIYINGIRHEIRDDKAFLMLADYLRYERGLTGTKIVCAEGDCGACTVLLSRDLKHFVPINACVAFVAMLDGCHVITVEALKENEALSPIQQAIVEHHGSQCGYCTPGFVMAMTGMFETPNKAITEQKVKNCLTGNLCRCTGYQPLIDAALVVDKTRITPLADRFITDASQEDLQARKKQPVHLIDDQREFFAPLSLDDAILFRRRFADACIISGATDIGVLVNKGRKSPLRFLSLHLVPELKSIVDDGVRISVGASVTLSELRHNVKQSVPNFARFLNLFASPQIKNMATLVGNVANGSPIADTVPFLMVADGVAHVFSKSGARTVPISELYRDYKTLALEADEIITHISFKKPTPHDNLRLEKVSQRKDLDISTVNLAFMCTLDDQRRITEARIAVGGVAASVLRLRNAEEAFVGKTLNDTSIAETAFHIDQEISPLSDLRGSENYRRMLVTGLFRRYCHEVLGHA